MAQLTALVTTTDHEFRSFITKQLRSSGMSIAITDERHVGATAPSIAIVDIRSGMGTVNSIERLRAAWPATAIFAVASSAEPDHILQAMRAGANEYLAWSMNGEAGPKLEETFQAALKRTVQRSRPKDHDHHSSVLSFFGAKGGAGTTTLAVNSAIEISRVSKKPTLIIDLHQFIGEVSLFLGVRPRFTLVDALDPDVFGDVLDARSTTCTGSTASSSASSSSSTRPASTSSPAVSRSTDPARRMPSRSNSFCRCSAGPTSTSSSTRGS